jgi:hypothetical protein
MGLTRRWVPRSTALRIAPVEFSLVRGDPSAATGTPHSGLSNIRDDHGRNEAGVRVIDIPRAVAQKEGGRDAHGSAVYTIHFNLNLFLKNMMVAVIVLNFETREHRKCGVDGTAEIELMDLYLSCSCYARE